MKCPLMGSQPTPIMAASGREAAIAAGAERVAVIAPVVLKAACPDRRHFGHDDCDQQHFMRGANPTSAALLNVRLI